MKLTGRVRKFLIVGLSAAFVNLSLMVLFVEGYGFKTYFLKNLANILSIEISIIYHFAASRAWTWSDAPKKQGKDLMAQCVSFHVANLAGMAIRAVIFAILEKSGVYYIVNVAIGIGLATAVSFVFYDRIVFKKQADENLSS